MGLTKDKQTGRPMIRLLLTPELEQQLEAWKEATGEPNSNTIRIALREYLADKVPVKDLKPRPVKEEKPAEKVKTPAEVRNLLLIHYQTVLAGLRNKYTNEWQKVNVELETDIQANLAPLKYVGVPPTISAVIEILLADTSTKIELKDYARMLLNPPSRDRPKK